MTQGAAYNDRKRIETLRRVRGGVTTQLIAFSGHQTKNRTAQDREMTADTIAETIP
jgi:hypothetical protein